VLADNLEKAQLPDTDLAPADAASLVAIREAAATHRAESELAAAHGIHLAAPFLDADIAAMFLGIPAHQRTSPHKQKPALDVVVEPWLPPEIRARSTKGDYTYLAYQGIQTAVDHIEHTIATGRLTEAGLIDPAPTRKAIRLAAAGIRVPLPALGRLIAIEAWLQQPRPRHPWTTTNRPEPEATA